MTQQSDSIGSSAARRRRGEHDHPLAFARLYDRYVAFTWRVVGQLGVPSHAIDDVVQEVWLVVHRRLPTFEGRAALKTWLFGVSLNVARNQRRSERRRQKHVPEPVGADASFDPERVREGREALERVERFLATLDEQRRAIFTRQLIQNRSALETARATGVDVLTVYRQVRLLRSAFKRWLRQELGGELATASGARSLLERPSRQASRSRSRARAHEPSTEVAGEPFAAAWPMARTSQRLAAG